MQRIFTKYLSVVMAVALLAVAMLNYMLQTRDFEQKMRENALSKMEQVFHTLANNRKELDALADSLHEDYLARARAFAYIIEQNPAVLDQPLELQKIKTLLKVDELHVIDGNGTLIRGTIPKYFGMDFASTEQTSEFLQILRDPNVAIVQDIRPNGAEQKIFQYVGVARKDQPGIVEIGLEPWRQVEARQRNELPYIFSRMALDPDTHIFALNSENGTVLAHSNAEKTDRVIFDFGFPDNYLEVFRDGAFFTPMGESEPYFFIVRRYADDIILGVSKPKRVLYGGLGGELLLVSFYLALTFVALLFAIRWLLKKQIVNGVHRIMDDLTEITDGNLDYVVKVDGNPEFQMLSGRINKMVKNLLDTTVKISHIIDLVEAPIGVFEYKRDMNRVLATERLRHVLSLSEAEARDLYSDKYKFIERLAGYQLYPEPEEKDVYRIGDARWIRLCTVSDETGVFGIVSDVTQEIREKKQIKKERDYDELTGLHSRRHFSRVVTELLECGGLGTAAFMMLDLDAFKQVNDRYGHDCGDIYLRATARFLASFRSGHCIAGRRSGDEFYLFIYNLEDRAELYGLLRGFYERLAKEPFHFPDGTEVSIQISAGIAWYAESDDFDDLMKNADKVLYQAKADSRHSFREFG